jgi:hypothetical protein
MEDAMSDELTQSEADILLRMEKHCADLNGVWNFPNPGKSLTIDLTNSEKTEEFILDIQRAQIKVTKATYQNRHQKTIVLARLDLDGPPHRNPDGEIVLCPHLHLYREGFGDKWAYPAPNNFTAPADLTVTLNQFFIYLNITRPPTIQTTLV